MIKFKQLISNLHCDVASGLIKFNLNLPALQEISTNMFNGISVTKEHHVYNIKIDFKKLAIDLTYALSSDDEKYQTETKAFICNAIADCIIFERNIYNAVKTSDIKFNYAFKDSFDDRLLWLDFIEETAEELFNTLVYIVEQSYDDKEANNGSIVIFSSNTRAKN